MILKALMVSWRSTTKKSASTRSETCYIDKTQTYYIDKEINNNLKFAQSAKLTQVQHKPTQH